MLRGILMAAIGGARSITPLATLANAARLGQLPDDNGAPKLLAHPLVSAGATALAAGELAGDKMKTAPDRIVLAGMIPRALIGALAGASLAPKEQRVLAASLGAAAALGAAYLTFNLRMRAIDRFGQTASGAVEDALALGSAALLVRGAKTSA